MYKYLPYTGANDDLLAIQFWLGQLDMQRQTLERHLEENINEKA